MNGTDLSCTENLSANIGKRGYRGITGPKGRPESYNTRTGPDGQPGADGTSRIDISFSGNDNEAYTEVSSPSASNISQFIFPGSTSWGTVSAFKLGVSFDYQGWAEGDILTATIEVKTTGVLSPVSILSAPLTYTVNLTSVNKGLKQFHIVKNGDTENEYTLFENVPTAETLISVYVKTEATRAGVVLRGNPKLEIYALELI